MKRALGLALSAFLLALTACGVSDLPLPDEDAVADSKRIKVGGIKFDRPVGWRTLDNGLLRKHAASRVKAHDVALSLGMTDRAFRKVKKSIDVYVVDEERNAKGAFDLVTVVDLGTAPPPDNVVGSATARPIETAVGDAVTATFTLGKGTSAVQAQTIVVQGDSTIVITVAAASRKTTTVLAEDILETLAEE